MNISDNSTASAAVWILAGALCALGCGATCDRTKGDPVRFEGGNTDLTAGFYETSPWDGPYLDFPAGRTYRLIHGLGARPRDVDIFLSFDRFPEESNTSPGAGNQALIEEVTADHVDVRNDTCSDIFLRVVASYPETP